MGPTATTEELPLSALSAIDTVFLDDSPVGPRVGLIDQTQLPSRLVVERIARVDDLVRAIQRLEVRGAPAIGVAAALGVYVAAWHLTADTTLDRQGFLAALEACCDRIASARPTAVNLAWAVNRMRSTAAASAAPTPLDVVASLREEALAIRDEDVCTCCAMGAYGLELVHDGDAILTHCNAGRLATVRYGTATAPVYVGLERGVRLSVYCDETRPLLQGARLTAFELEAAGVPTTLICDNMSASMMRAGLVQAVFVGCDRVAANGDTANKIGTSMVALAARYYGIPFYVCAPTSTIDLATPTGDAIPIEERTSAEVTSLWYAEPMAPAGVAVRNPAFDVTDAELITAFVTERGVVRPPFTEGLAQVCGHTKGR